MSEVVNDSHSWGPLTPRVEESKGDRHVPFRKVDSIRAALHHHTLGGAYAAFDEEALGSLEPGKYADFVIWNGDLQAVRTAEDAAALKPESTYLAGKSVYEAKHGV